jgi:hypothetical protein
MFSMVSENCLSKSPRRSASLPKATVSAFWMRSEMFWLTVPTAEEMAFPIASCVS